MSCTKLQLPPEPLTKGLPPPDPRSVCPLSSTEFVELPPPAEKKFLGTPLGSPLNANKSINGSNNDITNSAVCRNQQWRITSLSQQINNDVLLRSVNNYMTCAVLTVLACQNGGLRGVCGLLARESFKINSVYAHKVYNSLTGKTVKSVTKASEWNRVIISILPCRCFSSIHSFFCHIRAASTCWWVTSLVAAKWRACWKFSPPRLQRTKNAGFWSKYDINV